MTVGALQGLKLATAVPFAELRVSTAQTDRFKIGGVHHLSYLVPGGQALPWALRHERGLGMARLYQSSNQTGNFRYNSQVVCSGDVRLVFNAPYAAQRSMESKEPMARDIARDRRWLKAHNFGVETIAVNVDDATEAYRMATERGAKGVMPPQTFPGEGGALVASAIMLYTSRDDLTARDTAYVVSGDLDLGVKMMFVEGAAKYEGFFPGYRSINVGGPSPSFGIRQIDHTVLNTTDMMATARMLERVLGLRVFAIFRAEEVGSPKSALNSVVMSNDDGTLLLPINEGVDRAQRSQINEFLLANNGPGIQHVAFRTEQLIGTLQKIREQGLFGLLGAPLEEYYLGLGDRIGRDRVKRIVEGIAIDMDYDELLALLRQIGILVDRGDIANGVLFQIFTDPVGDDPTLFYEILQRACDAGHFIPGCGEFGLGNFNALFAAIERDQEKRGGSALQ